MANCPDKAVSAKDNGPYAKEQEEDKGDKCERTVENGHTRDHCGLDQYENFHVNVDGEPRNESRKHRGQDQFLAGIELVLSGGSCGQLVKHQENNEEDRNVVCRVPEC